MANVTTRPKKRVSKSRKVQLRRSSRRQAAIRADVEKSAHVLKDSAHLFWLAKVAPMRQMSASRVPGRM